MFDVEKSSKDILWMLSISVSAILVLFNLMRFLRQGLKGKKKRLVTYAIRFAVGTALAFVPLVMPLIKPIEELESYVLTRRFHSRSPSPFFLCETLKNQESDERELQMMRKWAER